MNSYQFEFVIPQNRDDLRSKQTSNQFYVSEVYSVKEIPSKIEECENSLKEMGSDFMLEHFGTLFSVLHHFRGLDFKILQRCYNRLIIQALNQVNITLYVLFDDDDIHPGTKLKMLNVTKMSIYVASEFLKSFQGKVDQVYGLVIDKRGRKNTKLVKLKEEHDWDWEENEKSALDLLFRLVKQPLSRLWDPPVPEDDFVKLIEDCCYSVLSKPSVTAIKMKPTRDLIFEILAILITQYNNAISCKVKIVQMLKMYEHLTSILAQAVVFFVQKYNCRSLIKEIMLEIIETNSEMESYSQDNSSSRVFSNFIAEIAAQESELVLPSVNILIPNLNSDPYNMRICALTVMAEIVTNVLHSEGKESLSEERRITRDNFLEHLLDHIVDVNVFVRSRVLKLWQSMFQREAVPKKFIIPVLDLAIQRLLDKSSNVVKNAVHLITLMLQNNPYAATLNEEAVKQDLRALKQKISESETGSSEPSVLKLWFCSRNEFSEFMANKLADVSCNFNNAQEGNNTDDEESENEETKEDEGQKSQFVEYIHKIRQSVSKGDFHDLFTILQNFDSVYLKSAKLLTKKKDIIQYYKWITGNICRDDNEILRISSVASCETDSELKALINVPISFEGQTEISVADLDIFTYFEDYLKFIETVRKATKQIGDLMMSGLVTETLEAIEFFKIAYAFGLSGAEEQLRNMLLLINSREPGIKEAVVNAYKSIYLKTEILNRHESAAVIVEKLTSLLKKLTHEQKKSLQDLIKHWAEQEELGKEFIQVLWDKYSRKLPNTSAEDSQAAIVLLTMYASGKPDIVRDNIELLVQYGLSRENYKYFALGKYTCLAFRVLKGAKNEDGVLLKYPANSDLIESLINIIVKQFTNFGNYLYAEIAMESITAIYHLSVSPDTVCERLIQLLWKKIRGYLENNDEKTLPEQFLIRIILMVGHIALSQWQYLENDVHCELKRRNIEIKSKDQKSRNKLKRETKNKKNSVTVSKSTQETITTDNFNDDSIAAIDERITESIRIVCENELLSDRCLLGVMSKLVIKVCQDRGKYPGKCLQSAASITFSKLMMISSEFCDQHIQLFITIMEKTDIPEVKINLILAFGDLTFRFPNTVEPWTVYFYNRLRDESKEVRYTSLLVISHLITNEMIKVKGQISDVALCLVDEDASIRKGAFHLFKELAVKGNTLYNLMPDIISRLSHPDYRPPEEKFQTIMKCLMKLISKDRHVESIVDKLCQRFGGAVDERQCVDLSYCLTLVSYSDRILQKVIDNIVCYAEELNHAQVHKNFTNIIITCKKQVRVGKLAELAEELEDKIDTILMKGADKLDNTFFIRPKTTSKTLRTPGKRSDSTSSRKLTRVLKNRPKRSLSSNSSSDESDSS